MLCVLVMWEVKCFSWRLKVDRKKCAVFLKSGWAFQAEHNRTCASSVCLTRGTSSWPQPADRRCRWPSMLATGLQSSARYPGAMLCWYLYTCMHSLNRISSASVKSDTGTGSDLGRTWCGSIWLVQLRWGRSLSVVFFCTPASAQ